MKLIQHLVLLFISIVSLNAQELLQNKADTAIDFKIKNLGIYVNGTFTDATITSNFNIDSLESSYINATIKVNSISTKNVKRDKHLLKDDFFDVDKYPEIKFVSTKIEKISENNYKLTAKLTIKSVTKNIVVPIEVNENSKSVTIKSAFNLNRRDYNVGGSSWVLSNTVKIQIVYNAKK